MTTTAEKIKELEERGQRLTHEHTRYSDAVHHWMEEVSKLSQQVNEQSRPPEPEPLECWAVVVNPKDVRLYQVKSNAETCQQIHKDSRFVAMREITPQDEEDRKDAARYRWWKYNHMPPSDNTADDPSAWDDRADNAMQGGNDYED